jgi:hypothetical protein
MSSLGLPGGIREAQTALADPTTPDRAHLLVDLIRRTYDVPVLGVEDPRAVRLRSLLDTLGRLRSMKPDMVPLPLTPAVWIDAVFKGRAEEATLAASILDSRGASLLYYGLLSLDDETRTWIAGERSLLADIVMRTPGAFVAAAPGLRMSSSGLHLPGGAAADPVWHTLVGRPTSDPAAFVRALLAMDEGRLASFVGALTQLSPAQVNVALGLDAADAQAHGDTARRLYAIYLRTAPARPIEKRTFTRPAFDPLVFLAELDSAGGAGPLVPASRGLWSAVFAENDGQALSSIEDRRKSADWRRPADFSYLTDLVFKEGEIENRRRGVMALFGARHLRAGLPATADAERDAVEAIRAAGSYPALTLALERAGIEDFGVFARAARRAGAIDALGDGERELRAHAQYQGALALVTQAAARHSLTPAATSSLVSSLSDIPLGKDGEYDGGLATWLCEWLEKDGAAAGAKQPSSWEDRVPGAAGPVEASVLQILSGPRGGKPRVIDWEGTSYHLDFARAQALRLAKGLGDAPRPYLSTSAALVRLADGLTGGIDVQALRHQVQDLLTTWREGATDDTQATTAGRHHDTIASLERAARSGDTRAASRLAPALRLAADDLLGRGLMELAYAAALGAREGVPLLADDAARLHEFGRRWKTGASPAWVVPQAGNEFGGPWHVKGTILGLDIAFAEFSLVSTSSRLPPRKPSVSDSDRRVFVETMVLADPFALADQDRDAIVAALRAGRARVKELRSADEVSAAEEGAGFSALDRTLLRWAIANDPDAVPKFFSLSQMLRLGLGTTTIASLDAWATESEFQACACLRFANTQAWNLAAGRSNSGMNASAFPDLNLRLAELLSELHMPAALLAPVLAAATQDFVTLAVSRDVDDRRGLSEYVEGLRVESVEQYLALLTTGGALVPVDPGRSKSAGHP